MHFFVNIGISKQTDHLPVRFFVEQIQDGYSIIFTGNFIVIIYSI